MNIRLPKNKEEIYWIAEAYEEIGAMYIDNYKMTKEGIENAVDLVEDHIENDKSTVLVLCENCNEKSLPIGMILCNIRKSPLDELDEGFIDALYITSSQRRKGYGRILIKKIHDWCKNKGVERIKTFVSCKNPEMISLCKKLEYDESFIQLQLNFSDK